MKFPIRNVNGGSIAAGAALLLVATACERGVDGPPFGELAVVETPANAPAGEPNLASGPAGQVYLSWIEQQPDSTHTLRFAELGPDGFGPARTIATGRNWFVNWADFPMVSAHGSMLAAHWLQRGGTGKYNYGVRISLSRDGGESWSAPLTPHRDSTPSEHGFVSLFPHGEGFGAVWLDARGHAATKGDAEGAGQGGMQLRFTSVAATGQLGEDLPIDERTCDCCQTSVAIASDGPLLAYRDRSTDEVRDIYIARYEQGRWSAGQPVHRDGWKIDFCPVNGPSIAAQQRRVALAWFTAADSLPRVLVAFSDDAGRTFGEPIRVDRGSPAGRVDVQLLRNGDALVSWLENPPESSLRVRRVNSQGELSSDRMVTTLTAERPSGFPHLIVAGDQVVFAWTDPGSPARIRVARAALAQ